MASRARGGAGAGSAMGPAMGPAMGLAALPLTVAAALLLLLAAGAGSQDRFPFRDFPNPVPYAPTAFLSERPRPFQLRDVQLQQQQLFGAQPFQQRPSFQQQQQQQPQKHLPLPFQQQHVPPFRQLPFQQLDAFQWEPKHPFPRNASATAFQQSPFQTTALPPLRPSDDLDFPHFFQDPHFEQLFQQELSHQIQLEQQRLQEQTSSPLPQPRPPPPQQHRQKQEQNGQQVVIQQSVQVERPQLQELQELHTLLEQELHQHEMRQRDQQRQQQQQLQQMIQQQQQQQQNQVDAHDQFMSQRIKPQRPGQLQQLQQQSPAKPTTPKQRPPTTTSRPSTTGAIEVLDLNQFLPFLDVDTKGSKQDATRLQQQQRQRQQQRQQETLRQQEERRQQEQRHKERLRQQRQQIQLQQQRQQEQEKRQKVQQQRQQRQQPPNGNGITGPGGASPAAANKTAAEKPVKSVRDLFNTTSCIEPPLTCPHPRIHFYLYTRTTQENGDKIDVTQADSLLRTPFNPKHPIKVLIHGFQGGRQFAPSTDLRKAYFVRGDYNIFVVDYNSLVRLPCLSQIQWSPSFLALCVSQLVGYVGQATGGQVPADRFHLIGYSIGAHIAGLVANYVERGKLGRITGLDPTIIFYQGSNRSHDLDPSDAHFIDVIHTGAGILGQRGPNGHVDYYVNGGTTQPGCQSDSLIKTLSCDHTKVSPYYVESIISPVGFWALPCPNLFMYLLGFCQPKDEDYILMGEDAPHTARGIYYLSTNGNKPYAKGFPGKKMPTTFPKWRPN